MNVFHGLASGRFSLREESVSLTVSSALIYLTAWRTAIS